MSIDRHLVAAALSPMTLPADELSQLAEALDQPPRPAIRIRPTPPSEPLPFSTAPVPWHSRGRFWSDAARPGATLEFAAGEFYIQDAASLLAVSLLDAQPGETVCDLCAAPGGKSTAILDDLGDRGWLLANETVHSRVGMLEFNLARHGSPRYAVAAWDPRELAERLPGFFDAVLVDAPCSGQSLIGRGKQTDSAFTASTMDHCAARQVRILDAAAQLVRPGGRLVYSTCTFAYVENEGQIESFLDRRPEWSLEKTPDRLSAVCSPSSLGVRLWPHLHGCGGAFAAMLRHSGGTPVEVASRPRTREPALHPSTLPAEFREWGDLRSVAVRHNRLQCFAWPEAVPAEFLAAAAAGPEVAFRKVNTWFPAYALALRRDPSWIPQRIVELSEKEAARYLRGEVLAGETRGWAVAVWRGKPLGWLKGDGRQWKNHLPKAGRLR